MPREARVRASALPLSSGGRRPASVAKAPRVDRGGHRGVFTVGARCAPPRSPEPPYRILNRFVAGNKTEGEPLMDFANGEILFQCLRLIGSGVELGRLLIAAERQGMVQVLPSAISGPQALRRRRLAEATPPRFRRWRNPLAVNGPATVFLKTL